MEMLMLVATLGVISFFGWLFFIVFGSWFVQNVMGIDLIGATNESMGQVSEKQE